MNDRSLQDILEWVVLGLLIAVGVLVVFYVGGWVFTFLGALLTGIASLVWSLLRIGVPLLLLAGGIYLAVRFLSRPKAT